VRATHTVASIARHSLGAGLQAILVAAIIFALLLALAPIYRPAAFLAGTGQALAAGPVDHAGKSTAGTGKASTGGGDRRAIDRGTRTSTADATSRPSTGAGGGGGRKGSCTRNAPGVSIENSWGWSQWGSWGMPGQQLTYLIDVRNYDVGCSSSSFVITASAPDGFSVSLPTASISLKSSTTGYLWAYVTSPSTIADGHYPLTFTVDRSGGSSPASATSTYKVYSSDTVAPWLYWPNPGDGTTITGSSYTVAISTSDDHAVKTIDLYLDDVYTTTASCDNISDTCQLFYNWSIRGLQGQHTATFRSYDWMGNVGVLTVTFTIG
jgi:hypothetical protein